MDAGQFQTSGLSNLRILHGLLEIDSHVFSAGYQSDVRINESHFILHDPNL